MSNFGKSQLSGRGERDRVFFLAAVGLALSLVVVVIILVNFRAANAREQNILKPTEQKLPEVGTVTLFVPDRLIPQGRKLSEFKFREIYWPRNQVPEGAVRDLAEIKDLFAAKDLTAGQPVLRALLSREAPVKILDVTPGNRAVTIEVNQTSSVEGFTQAGSHVDVVLTYQEEGKLTTKIIVENARVISAGGETGASKVPGQNRRFQHVTLDVSVQDALKITTAKSIGQLSLLMRALGENNPVQEREMNANKLAGKEQKEKPSSRESCNRGKVRMGDKQFLIGCRGELTEIGPGSDKDD